MKTNISRRRLLFASSSALIAGVGFAFCPTAVANDSSEFSGDLNITPSPGPIPKSLYYVYVPPYRWNPIREKENSWMDGDDIELFFRFPRTSKRASFYAPAGRAAWAARMTAYLGGLSFRPVIVGTNWEYKAVFGWRARVIFGGGRAPKFLSNTEANLFMQTYKVRYIR